MIVVTIFTGVVLIASIVWTVLLWKDYRQQEAFRLKSEREFRDAMERFRKSLAAFIDAHTDDRK